MIFLPIAPMCEGTLCVSMFKRDAHKMSEMPFGQKLIITGLWALGKQEELKKLVFLLEDMRAHDLVI